VEFKIPKKRNKKKKKKKFEKKIYGKEKRKSISIFKKEYKSSLYIKIFK
jgi:hypothetical protein